MYPKAKAKGCNHDEHHVLLRNTHHFHIVQALDAVGSLERAERETCERKTAKTGPRILLSLQKEAHPGESQRDSKHGKREEGASGARNKTTRRPRGQGATHHGGLLSREFRTTTFVKGRGKGKRKRASLLFFGGSSFFCFLLSVKDFLLFCLVLPSFLSLPRSVDHRVSSRRAGHVGEGERKA
jgi:hypothetical protein